MGILAINVQSTGQIGFQFQPRRCTMITTDNLAALTTAGYINNQNTNGNPIFPTDIFEILYNYDASNQTATFGIFQVTYNPVTSSFTLVAWADTTLPANVLVNNSATNQMTAGSILALDKGTGTEVAGAATISHQAGVLTTVALTTAAQGTHTITLTNTAIKTGSTVLTALMGGTNTTPGVQLSATALAGSSVITITNTHATAAFNGTLIIGFGVF